MSVDLYTKCVLTVIAAALIAIAAGQYEHSAKAQGAACGDIHKPCYVTVGTPLPVYVKSH